MKNRRYPISEEVFKHHIDPLIQAFHNRSGRPTKVSHYQFFCAVLYVLRTGIPWRDVPQEFGPWHTLYTRFKRWSERGLFWSILYDLQQKKMITTDIVWVDSTTVAL